MLMAKPDPVREKYWDVIALAIEYSLLGACFLMLARWSLSGPATLVDLAGCVGLAVGAAGAAAHGLSLSCRSSKSALPFLAARRFRSVSWIAWASVAGVAGFLVLAHYASFRSINLFSKDALLAVLAIIVAAVTVFYPLLLNRTFDQSQRALEQVKALQESNSQLVRDLRYLEADGELLRRAVLLPLVTHITLSSSRSGSAPDWSETLQVQAAALRLILAESPTEFRGRWEDFRGYSESARNQVAYFAEKAERHLADLVKHQPWQLDERQLGDLRDALRDWGKAARV